MSNRDFSEEIRVLRQQLEPAPRRGGIKPLIWISAGLTLGYMTWGYEDDGGRHVAKAETYRLVHAIGNSENYVLKNKSWSECQYQKGEYSQIVTLMGAGGSVTCLPESDFQ